jgi:hypothetical protein
MIHQNCKRSCKIGIRKAGAFRWTYAAFMALVLLSLPAAAQGLGEILLSAQAVHGIDPNVSIDVRVSDDTDLNIRLRDVVRDILHRTGFKFEENNPALVLQLQTQRLTQSEGDTGSIGQFRAGSATGRPTGSLDDPRGSEVDLNVKLWSSTKKSLLGQKRRSRPLRQGFQLSLEVHDAVKNEYVWRGSAQTAETGGDVFRVGKAMASHLVEVIGETVAPRIVENY